MKRRLFDIWGDNSAAVAPTVALSLVALIGAGGIAFDYARMASMDTELQTAADQAALAAAAQLDGEANACARAASAAANMVSNPTLLANDSGGLAVVVANESGCDAVGRIRFYQNVAKTTAATNDSNAKFVEVEVDPREAFYALTPGGGGLLLRSAYSNCLCRIGFRDLQGPAGDALQSGRVRRSRLHDCQLCRQRHPAGGE